MSSSVGSNALSFYIGLIACAVVVKSIYDSAAIEAHLNDIEDQLDILYNSPAERYHVIHKRVAYPWRHQQRHLRHRVRREKVRNLKQKLFRTRRALSQEKRDKRTRGMRSEAEEIQVEPLHSERTRFRPQQRRTKGTEVVSPYSVLKIGSRTKTAASDPSVFVFPYGQADRIENQSFAFYSGQPNSDRSTILQ